MRMAAGAVVQQNDVSLAVSLRREFVLSQNVPDYFGLELCRLASAPGNEINCSSNILDMDFLSGILMAMIEDCLKRNATQRKSNHFAVRIPSWRSRSKGSRSAW